MVTLWNQVRSLGLRLLLPVSSSMKTVSPWQPGCSAVRASSYDAYPKFEETPSPFKPKKQRRYGYNFKHHVGGVLPRPKEFEDIPLPATKIDFKKQDQWTAKKSLFGQNDYIDILGDGSVHPYQLMQGPKWLRGFRGNELQRLVRRLKWEGRMLADLYPQKHHEIRKQIFYLYKKLNTRRRSPYWSGGYTGGRSRFTNIKDRFK